MDIIEADLVVSPLGRKTITTEDYTIIYAGRTFSSAEELNAYIRCNCQDVKEYNWKDE